MIFLDGAARADRAPADDGTIKSGWAFTRPEWHRPAACAGVPAAIMYPTRGDHDGQRRALGLCGACPVTEICLEYALTNGEKLGIWGGKSERQRRLIRSARNRQRRAS
jgi:WhiB family redox-sensing transcriptional regulator